MSFDVRKNAWVILNTLDQGRRTLDALMEGYSGGGQVDSRRDRALLQTLVYGVLRWRGRLDHIISHFSSTRFDKIVKSPKFRHACEGRHPELFENTGFPPSRERRKRMF